MALASVPEIVAELKAGRIVVLVDDEDRENEGDLVFAADFVTPQKINFLAKHGRGLICMPIAAAQAERLRLTPMAARNRSVHGTNFTQSIEAATGIATGISAADRARTIEVASRPEATADDVVQPGHVFPLIAQDGGVLVRAGHTEACCDLMRLAGLNPSAVLCEIMNDDGTMARLPDLERFAAHHGLKVGAIADLIHYRSRTEKLVERLAERPISTPHGAFRLVVYRDKLSDATHLALVRGPLSPDVETLVRVHEPLSVIDLLDAQDTTHSWTIPASMEAVAASGRGVIVLLHRPETPQELRHERTLNPALGLRAIRWSLSEPGMFRQQLRALLRAGAYGPVRILIPMLAQLGEVRAVEEALQRARQQLTDAGRPFGPVQLGAMIEVPAAALIVDRLLQHFDFLSIGTNDLIQYTLAIDRADEAVAHLYDSWHPAVLQLLRHTIAAANAARKNVSVCGEMAGDPAFTELLLAMGLRSFSMHPACVAAIKQRVLRADTRQLESALPRIMAADDPAATCRQLARPRSVH